jgi:DMSO/TMAO reductase YedYZ molybdopterin-dependent catalytic subunit
MRFPWANTLLLVLIVAELVSGFLGLAYGGASDRAIFMQVHRVAGYGILVVLVWKGANILFSLRWRRAVAPRTASIALLAALVVTLGLGFGWSLAGPFYFRWFSGVSWHIYVGAAFVPILIWHAMYHTRGFPIAFWADRRSFLRLSGIVMLGAVGWQLGELGARLGGLSGASRRFTGSHEAGRGGFQTRPYIGNDFPLVSWLNDRPASIDASRWRLSIRGAVERELALSYSGLKDEIEVTATIDCTGGWYSTQVWRGVPLAELLARARPTAEAASITVTSVTGYYRRFSLDEASRYILATHVGGEVISHGHGFPLRLVAPGKRGFEWVKWVESIEVNETSKWLQPPLPLQ